MWVVYSWPARAPRSATRNRVRRGAPRARQRRRPAANGHAPARGQRCRSAGREGEGHGARGRRARARSARHAASRRGAGGTPGARTARTIPCIQSVASRRRSAEGDPPAKARSHRRYQVADVGEDVELLAKGTASQKASCGPDLRAHDQRPRRRSRPEAEGQQERREQQDEDRRPESQLQRQRPRDPQEGVDQPAAAIIGARGRSPSSCAAWSAFARSPDRSPCARRRGPAGPPPSAMLRM